MTEKCWNCGRTMQAHFAGAKCPMDTHVVIDANTIDRALKTGHPRLLVAVVRHQQKGILAGVDIDRLSIVEA